MTTTFQKYYFLEIILSFQKEKQGPGMALAELPSDERA
jgi:hypothetical protein